MSLVVHLQFSKLWTPNWRWGKPMIFVFDVLRSMGICIKLFTTISLTFLEIWKSQRTEILRLRKKFEQASKMKPSWSIFLLGQSTTALLGYQTIVIFVHIDRGHSYTRKSCMYVIIWLRFSWTILLNRKFCVFAADSMCIYMRHAINRCYWSSRVLYFKLRSLWDKSTLQLLSLGNPKGRQLKLHGI